MKTYGKAFREGGYWHIHHVPPHVSIRIKDLFKGAGTSVRPPYRFKISKEFERDLEWFTQRYPLEMGDEDAKALKAGSRAHSEYMAQTEHLYSEEYVPGNVTMKDGLELKWWQGQARDFFWAVGQLLLGDDVGVGKTISAAACLMRIDMVPAVVVVKTDLVDQWVAELTKWTNLRIHPLPDGKPSQLPWADVYIVKYTMVHKHIDYLITADPKMLIMDEVQEVRHTDTKKHKSCVVLHQHCARTLALSGTPIFNYGIETWNVFQPVKPSLFPDQDEFKRAWCSGDQVRDPAALHSYLMESRAFLRRTKKQVGLAEKVPIRTIVDVPYNQDDLDRIDAEAQMLARVATSGGYIERGQASRDLSKMVRKATGIAKAKGVAALVKEILDRGEKVMLAGWHRAVWDIWNRELAAYNPVMYTGSESKAKKLSNKNKFIKGETNLFFISLRSAVGLDGLQKVCKIVVVGEYDWSPAIHGQLIGRLDRMGQTEQVEAIFANCDSGSDPLVVDVLGIKKSQAEGIFDPLANAEDEDVVAKEEEITMKTVSKALAEHYARR